jgi:7-cyano-7-deazaguanine synthase
VSVVTLCSGGLDSALMSVIFKEQEITQHPLFVNYGQLGVDRELSACQKVCEHLGIGPPAVMDVHGYGLLIESGLTSRRLDVFLDAFTPGRNLLLLVLAGSYAFSRGSKTIAMGLLREDTCLFPDQTSDFIAIAEQALRSALGVKLTILLPLREFTKRDVVAAQQRFGIAGTYSCHTGRWPPCGECVSCREYEFDSEGE